MQRQPEFRRIQYYSPNPQRQVRRQSVPVPKRRFPTFAIAIIALIVVGSIGLLHHAGASSSASKASVKAQDPPPEPAKPVISESQMAEKIHKIIAANPDIDISVSIGDPRDGSIIHYGTDAIYEAASVAKVLTAVFYLHNVETGTLSLDKPIGDTNARHYLQIMIEQSDNTAWKTLNDIVDRDRLKAYAESIGFQHYDYTDNTFTSDDITHLFIQLQQGKLLNYEHTQLLLNHMSKASRSEYVKPALPPDVKFYHKAGWLEDRVHDGSIIDDGHHPYVLVIFTNGHAKYHATPRETILQDIARVTVARYISDEYLSAAGQ